MTCWATMNLGADGRGWVNGVEIHSDGPNAAHAAALVRLRRMARQCRRPVLVAATEPDGHRRHFVVTAEGELLPTHLAACELTRDPDAEEIPAAYTSRVFAVRAALEHGHDQQRTGLGLAANLEKDIVRAHGRNHPYRWRALELRAHAAAVCGLPGTACELYLGAARGWACRNSPAYWGAAERAYALWRHGSEPHSRMKQLAEALLDVLHLAGDEASRARTAVMRCVGDVQPT